MNKPLPPHVRTESSTGKMMTDVLLAFIPLGIFSFVNYGVRPVLILLISILSAMLAEMVCCAIAKKPLRGASDGTAAVTGLIIGLAMSPMVAYWLPALTSVFAIVVAKAPFGGTGRNVFNPAAAGLAVMTYCFPSRMFTYPALGQGALPLTMSVAGSDVISAPSLAAQLQAGASPALNFLQLFLGDFAGPIGATAGLILLAFVAYLIIHRTASGWVVLPYLITCTVFAWLFPLQGMSHVYSTVAQVCAGYVLFTGVFLINDPVTAPRFWLGRAVYGVATAILVMLLQRIGRVEAGSCFAILIMNALAPVIDRFSWQTWHRLTKRYRIRQEVKAYE